MKYLITVNGRTREVGVDGNRVTLDGQEHRAELSAIEGTPIRLLVLDGKTWSLPMEAAAGSRGSWSVVANGEQHEVVALDERTAHLKSLTAAGVAAAGPASLKAPMPGLVLRILVSPGQAVAPGTSLVVLEAMKMENELKAPAPGTVDQIAVAAGQTVEKGDVLLSFRQ
jgi:biotin carboxyl carrier protein